MPSPRLINPVLETELSHAGFTKLRLFQADEAAAIHRQFVQLTERQTVENHGPIYLTFFETHGPRRGLIEEAAKTLLATALAPHLAGGRIQNAGAVVKNPGAERLAIHHHTPVTDAYAEREIVCWCPLTDVNGETGALRVIPRSHDLLPFIRLPKGADYFAGFSTSIENYAVTLPLHAGEAILFDNRILHGSAPNKSDEPRYAITVQVVEDGAKNGLYLDAGDGLIEFIETPPSEALQRYVVTGVRPADWVAQKKIGNNNRSISEEEFRTLLGRDLHSPSKDDPRQVLQNERTFFRRCIEKMWVWL